MNNKSLSSGTYFDIIFFFLSFFFIFPAEKGCRVEEINK